MSDNSRIEWTDATWNPVVGCTKVSPGCDHCYAERLTERFHGPGSFATVTLKPDRLDQPLRWRRPRRVFVNSMSDLFHDDVPDDYIADVFAVMAQSRQHTFQVLTKRHGRMRSLLNRPDFLAFIGENGWLLPNVWLGVSVENQQWADIRIPALLDTPAAVRFLSCEPLLGPIDLGAAVDSRCWHCDGRGHLPGNNAPVQGFSAPNCWHCNGTGNDERLIDWVIVGGESGRDFRAPDPEWVRSLRDQCDGVAFLFKQWGGITAKSGGRTLDGRTWDEYPEPRMAVA